MLARSAAAVGQLHMLAQPDAVPDPKFLKIPSWNESLDSFRQILSHQAVISSRAFCLCIVASSPAEFSLLCQACTEKGVIIAAT
jgi:hypothetical protein